MAIKFGVVPRISSIFLAILFTLLARDVLATGSHLYFKGHIVSDQDTIRLTAMLTRNPITGQGEYENEEVALKVDRHGNFSFSFTGVSRPCRLSLWDDESSVYILMNAVAEPGDSIVADLNIHAGTNGFELSASFSGKNAVKYDCEHELDAHRDGELLMIQDYNKNRVLPLADSVLAVEKKVLHKYQYGMSGVSRNIVKCDVLGSVYEKVLTGLCGNPGSAYRKAIQMRTGPMVKARFDSASAFVDAGLDQHTMSMSLAYINFLHTRSMWEYVLRHPEDSGFSLTPFCNQLVSEYHGSLRDHLIALTLVDDLKITSLFHVVDCKEYTNWLKRAVSIVGTPWIKNVIYDRLRSRGLGEEAFNFSLPADSSGKLVSLRSLRGKVVLVDMWGYQCTGCTEFAQAFHKAVYPIFKDDSDFQVVSILQSPTPYRLYLSRLRNTPQPGFERFSTYTYPDYINLFGGLGEESGRKLAKHYNINGDPFIILIDRNGKIYSSTVPFFTDTQSVNVPKMVKMIKEALM